MGSEIGLKLVNQKQTKSGDMNNLAAFESIKGSAMMHGHGHNNMSVIVQPSNNSRKIPINKHKTNLGGKPRITEYNFYQHSAKMDNSSVLLDSNN